MIQKIFKAKKYFEEAGYGSTSFQDIKTISIKALYQKLLGVFSKVLLRRLVCNNYGILKWIFIRLAVLGRLTTKDRLEKQSRE